MSIQVMNAVWKHSQSTGRARLVLLAIADHQGEMGAWPSIATLADMTNASELSVKRDIAELEALGELKVQRRQAPTGGQYRANLYWVTLKNSEVTDSVNKISEVTDWDSEVTEWASEVTAGGPITLNRNLDNNHIADEQFESFWSQYPRSESKAQAKRAYQKAIRKISHEKLMEALTRYKHHNSKNQIIFAYAATWLNGERCLDEYEAPGSPYAEKSKIEREQTKEFLAEQEKLAKQAAPVPKCEHGESILRCRKCLRS